MAQSGRFALAMRVLVALSAHSGAMLTSAAIGEELGVSPVMVRRSFLMLQKGGWIMQRKGPHGGAQLKVSAKQIGLGDLFAATSGEWLSDDDAAVGALLKKVRGAAVAAMNETTVAQVGKRLRGVRD